MTANGSYRLLVAVVVCMGSCTALRSQEPSCSQVSAMARMARASSSTSLATAKQMAGDGYLARVIYSSRALELKHGRKSAVLLLNLIPKDNGQQRILMTLGDGICSTETISEMKVLGRLRDRLPHALSKAILLVPEQLPNYVAYALTSVQNPESDYAVQMRGVCQSKHPEFVKAVEELPADKREWFVKRVFNPEGCHALALPEAQ